MIVDLGKIFSCNLRQRKETTRLGKGNKMCFQLSIAISMEEIFNVIHLRVVILSGLLAKELIPAFEKWKK